MTARNFTTPVGRLVGGDIFQSRDKDFEGRPLTTRDNKPRVEHVIAVAFPKSDSKTEEIRREIYAAAVEGFPTLFPGGQCVLPTFSFKWVDGDSTVPNQRGVKPCEKEGYPGHWVISFKSSFAPKVYGPTQEPIVDPKAIKRGDYIRVGVSARGNASQSKPGVYLNHSMIQFCGYGEEISTGPDAATVFAAPIQLPAGASATPMAPPGGMPSGMPMPAPGVAMSMPATGMGMPAPGVPMGMAPAPMAGFGMAPPPAAPPPPAAKQVLPGAPASYEALRGAGWTDEQMKSAGYLA